MRLALCLGGLAVLMACCPVPFPEKGLEVPEVEIEVRDAQGVPVPSATVTIRRWIVAPSPRTELSRATRTTDGTGRTGFGRIVVDEVSAPLMMHGRPDLGFELCAEKPGLGSLTVALEASGRDPGAAAESLVVVLDPAQPTCQWTPP